MYTSAFCSGFLGPFASLSWPGRVYSRGEKGLFLVPGGLSLLTSRKRVSSGHTTRSYIQPCTHTGRLQGGICTGRYTYLGRNIPGYTGRYTPPRVYQGSTYGIYTTQGIHQEGYHPGRHTHLQTGYGKREKSLRKEALSLLRREGRTLRKEALSLPRKDGELCAESLPASLGMLKKAAQGLEGEALTPRV